MHEWNCHSKKNIKEKIKNTENIESLEELTKQGIDIFNPENDFYTDLCFHFKSPINGKDIPVKDRIKLFRLPGGWISITGQVYKGK